MASDGSRGSPPKRLVSSEEFVVKEEQRNHSEVDIDMPESESPAARKRLKTLGAFRAEATASTGSAGLPSSRVISLDDGTEHLCMEATEEELAQMDRDERLFVGADGEAKSGDQVMELTDQWLAMFAKQIRGRTQEKVLERRQGRTFPTITANQADALYNNLDPRFGCCDPAMRQFAEIAKGLPIALLAVQHNDLARGLWVMQNDILVAAHKDAEETSNPAYEKDDEGRELA